MPPYPIARRTHENLRAAGVRRNFRSPRCESVCTWPAWSCFTDIGTWIASIVVLIVLLHGQSKLLEMTLANGAAPIFTHTREHREENRCEYCNYSNHGQQFNEGKSLPLLNCAWCSYQLIVACFCCDRQARRRWT
jgi:hypothetical protein